MKTFLIKKMFSTQLTSVSQEDQDKLFALIEKNPDLFQKIASEVQEKIKSGKDQMAATMEVAGKYTEELKGLM